MPIGEIAGEAIGAIFRFLGHVLIDGVIDFLVRGLGYVICKRFSKSVDPDGAVVIFVGIMAWVVILVIGAAVASFLQESAAVDSCLDSGGRFDYERGLCVQSD